MSAYLAWNRVRPRDRGIQRGGWTPPPRPGTFVERVEAKAQAPAFSPLEVIDERPEKDPAQIDAIANGTVCGTDFVPPSSIVMKWS